jgi:hypothetical protein
MTGMTQTVSCFLSVGRARLVCRRSRDRQGAARRIVTRFGRIGAEDLNVKLERPPSPIGRFWGPIRGGIVLPVAIIRYPRVCRRPAIRNAASTGYAATYLDWRRYATFAHSLGASKLCVLPSNVGRGRVVGTGHRLMPIDHVAGPNNRHNRLSGGLVPPFKYRKYRTEILFQIPGNIPRFVRLSTYCGDPTASCPLAFSNSSGTRVFLLGRFMFNALHQAGRWREQGVGRHTAVGFSDETPNLFRRIGRA